MFSYLGLFREIQCPQIFDCNLQNCFFNHDDLTGEVKSEAPVERYEPTNIEQNIPPPLKKRRVDTLKNSTSFKPVTHDSALDPIASEKLHLVTPEELGSVAKVHSGDKASRARINNNEPAKKSKFALKLSSDRTISPPPKKRRIEEQAQANKFSAEAKEEKLIPRTTVKDPISFPQRMNILQKFHLQIVAKNVEFAKTGKLKAELILTEQEMIKLALNEEEKAAQTSSSPDGYKNALAQRLSVFRKMTREMWESFVSNEWRKPSKDGTTREGMVQFATGVSTEQELVLVRHLRTPLEGLESYGYVTAAPSPTEIATASATHAAVKGWENCDRCGTRFQVFPGRNDDGLLTTRGSCTYHWARIQRHKGQAVAVYPCCSKNAGSEGCTTSKSHCFKVTDPKRLAALLQFERTPLSTAEHLPSPVAFDCEMAYTTYGMELIRLTAISWPQKDRLLDVLVRPYGEILDLNTRFSGVNMDQFSNAPLRSSTESVGDSKLTMQSRATATVTALHKVESPAIARKLLFDIISPNTPLIGHAIDNDLNACRIIHPFVIDTVLLFPHPRGLPVRYKLKDLSHKYLQRQIQAGGVEGHDSMEDSSATGDLVLVKVSEKWKQMRLAGWKWENHRLVEPS